MSAYPLRIKETARFPALPSLADLQQLRVAVVHEWLTSYAGSEKVLEQILDIFPAADIFSLVDHLPEKHRGFLKGRPVTTSFMQRIPGSSRIFRKLLWLMPSAVESLDLSSYDIVISSSHAVAKGVLTGPDQVHICYCHSPIRYAWDLQHEYLTQAGLDRGLLSIYARVVLHYLRLWDLRTANGVDEFVANSRFVARRIHKVYNRTASVVHPPVDVESFSLESNKDEYYITASRMVPYKRVDLIVEAFSKMPHLKLIVVGTGPGMKQCQEFASPNIEFLGYQTAEDLHRLISKAKALVFAAEEDFGITVVEAQACGTPVIAYGRGGALDSIVPDRTGILFGTQTSECIIDSVERLESGSVPLLTPAEIRRHAMKFGRPEFKAKFVNKIAETWLKLHQQQNETLSHSTTA